MVSWYFMVSGYFTIYRFPGIKILDQYRYQCKQNTFRSGGISPSSTRKLDEKHIIGTKRLLLTIIMGITYIAHTLLFFLTDPPYLYLANGHVVPYYFLVAFPV